MSYEQGIREPVPPYGAPPNGPPTASSTTDIAKEQSAEVAGVAMDQGSVVVSAALEGTKQVAAEAKQQVQEVTRQARNQVSDLISQTHDEIRDQASAQTTKAAANLRSLEGQLTALTEGRPDEAGQIGDFARQLSDKIGDYADRLEHGGYQRVINDVQRFARRRPGVFLLSAAATGLAVGRLVRGAQAANADSGQDARKRPYQPIVPGQSPVLSTAAVATGYQPSPQYTGTPGSTWGKEQPGNQWGESQYPHAPSPYPPSPSPYPESPAAYPTQSSPPQYPASPTAYPPQAPAYPTGTQTGPPGPEAAPFPPGAHTGQP